MKTSILAYKIAAAAGTLALVAGGATLASAQTTTDTTTGTTDTTTGTTNTATGAAVGLPNTGEGGFSGANAAELAISVAVVGAGAFLARKQLRAA